MYYRHELKYDDPERSDGHMLVLKTKYPIALDEHYDYIPRGAWFRFKRICVAALLHLVVFPLTRLTHGLRIYGRKNLRRHKKELRRGAITVSNHVFMWDYLCVQKAIRPHISYFPAWKPNFESGFSPFMRILGVCRFDAFASRGGRGSSPANLPRHAGDERHPPRRTDLLRGAGDRQIPQDNVNAK